MDAVNATVTEPAEKVETSRGIRVVTNFETENGKDAKVWCDSDSGEANFAFTLGQGEEVLLMKGDGKNGAYYKFRESDVENVESGGGSSSSSSGGSEQLQVEDFEANADYLAATYRHLDKRFSQMAQSDQIRKAPTEQELSRMAISTVIHTQKHGTISSSRGS